MESLGGDLVNKRPRLDELQSSYTSLISEDEEEIKSIEIRKRMDLKALQKLEEGTEQYYEVRRWIESAEHNIRDLMIRIKNAKIN
jgi:hypothetical protein